MYVMKLFVCSGSEMMEYMTLGSSGSDTLSGSAGCSGSGRTASRVRTVRLARPSSGSTLAPPSPLQLGRHGPAFGFSLRGGREHGTGFFVSGVELGSEAHRQGLRVSLICSMKHASMIRDCALRSTTSQSRYKFIEKLKTVHCIKLIKINKTVY